MCWTFFFFIWCSCIQPVLMLTTSWDLVTSPVVFGKPVELRCTVAGNASCCSKYTRIWSIGSKIILTNGITSLPSKYKETIDAENKQFSLVINDLSKEDVDVGYRCAYGNMSPQKTLTQNDSFEYHPTESKCPVKIHNGELVGTLIVNMSAPHPSVTAQYGDSNLTSYLTTIITPVAGSTKFYTINSSLKGKTTCRNNEKFTLSVLTGVTTTNICNNVTLCTGGIHDGQCNLCALWSFLCSWSSAVLIQIIVFIAIRLKKYYGEAKHDERNVPYLGQKGVCLDCVILVIALMNTVVPALVGYFSCTCIIGSYHWCWIINGVGLCLLGIFSDERRVHDHQYLLSFICTLFSVHCVVGLPCLLYSMYKKTACETLKPKSNIRI